MLLNSSSLEYLDRYLYWIPDGYLSVAGLVTIHVYTAATWLALVGGAAFWFVMLRHHPGSFLHKAGCLLMIALMTIFCTRLVHAVFYDLARHLASPGRVLQIGAGRSIHGSLLGFVLGSVVGARWLQMPVARVADILSFWPVLGLSLARIGNFFNSEQIGIPSTWPTAVRFYFGPDHGRIPRHPVQLYESAWALGLLLLMVLMAWRGYRRDSWLLPAMALIGLSVGRIWTDMLRHGPGHLAGETVTTGQILSVPFLALGVYLLWRTVAARRSGSGRIGTQKRGACLNVDR